MRKKITIGITMGDPSGIGPEVVAKSLRSLRLPKGTGVWVFGDGVALMANGFKKPGPAVRIIDHGLVSPSQMKSGVLSKQFGRASLEYIKSAVRSLRAAEIDCLVTGPVSKKAICLNGIAFEGHTEFLADQFCVERYLMMFVADTMRVSVVSRHIPLGEVAARLSRGAISRTIDLTFQALKEDFRIKNPRIAVLGLNPHASDGGIMGHEEADIIAPAIQDAQRKNNPGRISGPLSPDTVFHRLLRNEFDALVCMYHDQALIPFKMLHFNDGVNMTVGLPFVRTSCDHGTAFEIAGKNKADFHSMRNAIELACRLSLNRLSRR